MRRLETRVLLLLAAVLCVAPSAVNNPSVFSVVVVRRVSAAEDPVVLSPTVHDAEAVTAEDEGAAGEEDENVSVPAEEGPEVATEVGSATVVPNDISSTVTARKRRTSRQLTQRGKGRGRLIGSAISVIIGALALLAAFWMPFSMPVKQMVADVPAVKDAAPVKNWRQELTGQAALLTIHTLVWAAILFAAVRYSRSH